MISGRASDRLLEPFSAVFLEPFDDAFFEPFCSTSELFDVGPALEPLAAGGIGGSLRAVGRCERAEGLALYCAGTWRWGVGIIIRFWRRAHNQGS